MRLDFNVTAVAATDATEQVQKKHAVKSTDLTTNIAGHKTAAEDKTTLSSGTDSVDSLTKAALEPSPTRQARVEALRQQVNKAQYQLDAAKISEAILSADI